MEMLLHWWLLELSRFDGTATVQGKLAIYMIIALYLVAPFVLTIFTYIIYRNMKVEEDIAEMKAAKAN